MVADTSIETITEPRRVVRRAGLADRTGGAADQCLVEPGPLEILGDWWTLLVIREAFLGTRRFAEFAANLPIARNILAARLDHLVEHGVMARVDAGVHGTRYEYELTATGKDLITVVTALRQWSDRWVFGAGNEPVLVLDRRTGRPIPRLRIVDETGAPIGGRDLEVVVGPAPLARPGPATSGCARPRPVPPASPGQRRSGADHVKPPCPAPATPAS